MVTADIPLASRVVAQGAEALDPRGSLYSSSNVGERLALRDLMADLRNAATAQETWLTDTGVYNDNSPVSDATVAADADPVELGDVGFKYSTASNYADSVAEITVVADTNQSYTLSAVSASGNCFEYSSPDGLKEVDCA